MKLLTWIYKTVLTGLLVVFGNKGGVVPPSTPSADSGDGGRTASLVIIDDPMRPDRETLADREAKDHAADSFAFALKEIHPTPWVDEDILKYLRSKGLK